MSSEEMKEIRESDKQLWESQKKLDSQFAKTDALITQNGVQLEKTV